MTARAGSPAPSDTIPCPWDTHISPHRAPEIFLLHGKAAHPQQGQAPHVLENYQSGLATHPLPREHRYPLLKRVGATQRRQMKLETTAPGRCWWLGTAHPPQLLLNQGRLCTQGKAAAQHYMNYSAVPVLLPLESYMNAANANLSGV